ncbi:hypothetical protein KIW84_035058 [Lathyrus oleraceus]|uniref:Uncharacterized protein n=1 Tax=Pisum sativum TaxID=3888 RepID=A0A9D4Y2M7_PEA|nr:hypothetical protein KIW84_035058 [Pisum sativum]
MVQQVFWDFVWLEVSHINESILLNSNEFLHFCSRTYLAFTNVLTFYRAFSRRRVSGMLHWHQLRLLEVEPVIIAHKLHSFLLNSHIPVRLTSIESATDNHISPEFEAWEQQDQLLLVWIGLGCCNRASMDTWLKQVNSIWFNIVLVAKGNHFFTNSAVSDKASKVNIAEPPSDT